jgi:excisionase family DNA binding protein
MNRWFQQSNIRAKAAAERLSVSAKMIYKLVRQGDLEAVRVGRSVCVSTGSLEAYIARNTRADTKPSPVTIGNSVTVPTRRRKTDPAVYVFLPPPS